MIQVLVVEDSRITRDAIESQIAKSERYVLYASIENAANAEIACLRGSVDLILMDVCTADEESGLKAAAKKWWSLTSESAVSLRWESYFFQFLRNYCRLRGILCIRPLHRLQGLSLISCLTLC